MIMRPDLFEQHTVQLPRLSERLGVLRRRAGRIGGDQHRASFTYYYLAPDAGTYFWHCHITPPEHCRWAWSGSSSSVRARTASLSVRACTPRASNRTPDLRTACVSANDILCSNPLPAGAWLRISDARGTGSTPSGNYAYNDGDGSTYYDVEYPIQIHGFDPNFHFVA